jgi:hypothetical protein
VKDKEMMHQVFGMQYGPGKKRKEKNNIHDVQKTAKGYSRSQENFRPILHSPHQDLAKTTSKGAVNNTYQKRNHILDIVLNESSSAVSRPFCLIARHSSSLHSDITELNSTTLTVS